MKKRITKLHRQVTAFAVKRILRPLSVMFCVALTMQSSLLNQPPRFRTAENYIPRPQTREMPVKDLYI